MCQCWFVVPCAGLGASQSQPASKVLGAGAGLWCRVQVPVTVIVATKVPGSGAGLSKPVIKVPVCSAGCRMMVLVSVSESAMKVPGAGAG